MNEHAALRVRAETNVLLPDPQHAGGGGGEAGHGGAA